jgi:hypothetical protein
MLTMGARSAKAFGRIGGMRGFCSLLVLVGVAVGLVVVARWTSVAQDRAGDNQAARATLPPEAPDQRGEGGSIQDALLQPYAFPFREPTSLDEVARHLGETLPAKVVLDRAALGRLGITSADTVQLELEGVRLKVGLKLLLDQVGLAYKVVPEDGLLILTDSQGSEEPIERILAEIKAIHRDLHDVQDAVDDLRLDLGFGDEEDGSMTRKPVFINARKRRAR